jgi:ribosomal-protein-alanine N-acetyltransferase
MNIQTLETERMLGQRPSRYDFADLDRLHHDPRVMRTLSRDGNIFSHEQTAQWLESNMAHWERYGFGAWLFRNKARGDFIGRGGLRHTHAGGHDEVELAYAISSAFWNQGYASEIARASLHVGFEQLELPNIVCFTLTTNRVSQRVMEKAGFRYERNIVYVGLPHKLYRIDSSDLLNDSFVIEQTAT